MNKTDLSALALATVMSASAAEMKPVEAPVTGATVFLNGAELEHQATLDLQKGDNVVVLEGLSPQIDRQSLQVSLTAGVVVSSFEYGIDYMSADKRTASTQQLQDQLKALKKEAQGKEEEMANAQKLLELLETGVEHSLSADGVNVTAEVIEKNLKYYEQRMTSLQAQVKKAAEQLEELNKKIADLERQIKQDATPNARRAGILTLTLNTPKAMQAKAEIRYFTKSARWKPYYDLRVEEVGKPIDLMLKAFVSQNTGLDWKKVALTLSTGTPSRSNSIPEFTTWFIRRKEVYNSSAREVRAKACANAGAAGMAPEPMMMDVAMEMAEPMMARRATIEDYTEQSEQALSVSYKIDIPYTILGNGKEQTIALKEQNVDSVEYKYYGAPKLDGATYLTATIKNKEQLGLLEATAAITYNNTYYGETQIDPNRADDLKLTLGDDKQITIEREKQQDFSKQKMLSKSQENVVAYKITVRNNKKTPVALQIEEPFPISMNSEIVVELTGKTSDYSNKDENRGILTFDLDLAPGEQKEIVVEYKVTYPKDWKLNW